MVSKQNEPLQVVHGVDLTRYQGLWYEIASMPSRFQPKTGTNTTATYTLRPDQTIHVLNQTWVDGKRGFIEGTAWKIDPTTDEAKLKVRFWVPPFLPVIPVTGDYWVMLLDAEYQWALVGQPSRKYLWVLSRTPQLDDEVYSKLLEHAKAEGYDVTLLRKTCHDETVGEASEQNASSDGGAWWLKSILGK